MNRKTIESLAKALAHQRDRLFKEAADRSDREIEAALHELAREDGRIDVDELRIVCRHGVVYLDGAVPVTEDVVKSNEEGIDYTPPVEPPPDEE